MSWQSTHNWDSVLWEVRQDAEEWGDNLHITTETDCRLWAEWSRFRNPVGARDFSFLQQRPVRSCGSHSLLFYIHWGSLPGESDRGVKISTCLHPQPRLKMSGAKPKFPLYSFIKWTTTALLLPYYTVTIGRPCEFLRNSDIINKVSPACPLYNWPYVELVHGRLTLRLWRNARPVCKLIRSPGTHKSEPEICLAGQPSGSTSLVIYCVRLKWSLASFVAQLIQTLNLFPLSASAAKGQKSERLEVQQEKTMNAISFLF